MSLLSELKTIFSTLEIPIETGVFTDNAPDIYAVLTPLNDVFDLYADNRPSFDNQGVRISLYAKGNYIKPKNRIVKTLLNAELCITDRFYLGFETATNYHHYNIDVENVYEMEE